MVSNLDILLKRDISIKIRLCFVEICVEGGIET